MRAHPTIKGGERGGRETGGRLRPVADQAGEGAGGGGYEAQISVPSDAPWDDPSRPPLAGGSVAVRPPTAVAEGGRCRNQWRHL